MAKKMRLEALKINSFVTSKERSKHILGGVSFPGCPTFTNCNTCQCSEAYTICCTGGGLEP